MQVRLTGKVSEVEVTADAIRALRLKWKSRDVESELLKMHLWLLRYPKRRPVRMWAFIDNWLKNAPAVLMPPTLVEAWWATDERTLNQGEAVGILPKPGESMQAYRHRLSEAMKGAA